MTGCSQDGESKVKDLEFTVVAADEIPEELAAKAIVLAKKMAGIMTEALGCDGFNIVQNNGEAAGQTVFHFHVHLIPRYNGDDAGFGWKTKELDEATKEEVLAKVQARMEA